MRKIMGLLLVLLLVAFSAHHASADRVHVVRRISDYTCMMLNLTPEQAVDPKIEVPVRAEPRTNAAIVGYAMPVVAVKLPLKVVNGFYAALFPSGHPVWIAVSIVRPYHSLGDPSAKCVPAIMSNGLQGFDYYH
jgi:hypothetical protein